MKEKRKKQPPTRNPGRPEMELNSPETCSAEWRRSQKVKHWVSNQNPSLNPSQNQVLSLQSVRNLAKKSSGSRDVKGRQALEEKMGEMKRAQGRFKFSASMNRLTGSSTDRPPGQRSIFPNFLAFSCLVILLPALFS